MWCNTWDLRMAGQGGKGRNKSNPELSSVISGHAKRDALLALEFPNCTAVSDRGRVENRAARSLGLLCMLRQTQAGHNLSTNQARSNPYEDDLLPGAREA